ncbi:MAG: ParB N-terminal domain-containing protein [Candidatus Omnitrophota bacterium]|nr:ParB N-terminal domain-containing protein [Candidatus Omnitrophota bacterium]
MKSLEKNTKYIQLSKISFDVNNPRGEKEHQIITDPEFHKLVLSIKAHGILEPLIVKKDPSKEEHFILIDGERRLRAATKVSEADKNGDSTVPVLIAKDDADGRILAYQVHMLRKNWDKAAETKSIKTIIADLKQKNPTLTEKEIIKQLKEITAHTDPQISDLLKLIKYDDKVIEKVISGQIDMSHLIQNEASFINPLKREYPSLFAKYGEDNLRKILIEKVESGFLVGTRYLMDGFKNVFADSKNKKQIEPLLDTFLANKAKNIRDTYSDWEKLNPGAKKKESDTAKTPKGKKRKSQKENKSNANTFKKINLTAKEENTLKKVRKNYESIGKKLTQEENEYIAEGIYCLENNCLKAASVMIWAAGISKVINHIAKNISDFNTVSSAMSQLKKDPYKHLGGNYKLNISSADDLRDGKDWQLLYYMLYKKIISKTELNKLKTAYTTRCDCAHPTDVKLSPNEVITIYDNIYRLLFTNSKLT